MTELRLRESGPPVTCQLTEATVRAFVDLGLLTGVPLRPGWWEVTAGRKVGVATVGGVTVWVHPRVPVARLLWLLGWAKRRSWLTGDPAGYVESDELVPALAEAFCLQAERALGPGLLQGYREVDDSGPTLRGRLRVGDQMRERHGLAPPLLVHYDDFTVDIAENQMLRAASRRLLHLPGVSDGALRRLRRLVGRLADVSDLVPRQPQPEWRPTRLNARYHQALAVAELILADGSVEVAPGDIWLNGFVVDLYQVFENFVTVALSAALERIGGRCFPQDRSWLDDDGRIEIKPDLLWRVDGRPIAVVDAKYKAEKPAGFPQADYYQALAYATAHGLPEAHLVYAQGNEEARTWTVRHVGVRITAHTLDLSAAPEAILRQVEYLAGRIAGNVPGHQRARRSFVVTVSSASGVCDIPRSQSQMADDSALRPQ